MPPKKGMKLRGKKEGELVDPGLYYEIFQRDGSGKKILEEMSVLFENRLSHVSGDSHQTAFNEGQRSVMLFIYQKCANAQEGK